MFTDKHVVIALLVAPVLAVLAWFAVGHWFGESPHPAVVGSSYALVAQSNCRYESGQCEMRNGEMRLLLTFEKTVSGFSIILASGHALDSAYVAVVPLPIEERVEEPGDELGEIQSRWRDNVTPAQAPPQALQPFGDDGTQWRIQIDEKPLSVQRLLVVVSAKGVRWYGETGTVFVTQ